MTENDRLEQLKSLVSNFSANIAEYKSGQYDESNTRTDFIDKFFILLDWDVANNQAFSESYRDVVREDKVKIDGTQKAPDYSFRIGGARKFFVEAKKPSVNIREAAEPAYQIRRYAYTAKLPLSVLTNFEEFAIYDTRIKPDKNDKASAARIDYFTFKEYEQKFDFLYNTFSKNAINKGSFDKYVIENKNKKGTSEVDTELLALVEEWRILLAKNIAKNNLNLSVYNLNAVVQKIIDRIVFLRIAEDRGIEDENILLTVAKTSNIYEKLNLLFTKANVKYNSGLFAYIDWIEKVNIEDKILSDIIVNLYYPECPYEFSVLPIEILGSIYERFLGNTIRFRTVKGDTHTAVVEEKPEVKKAGGVYYTPQYIVDYIVKNTVGEKIKNKKPEEIAAIKICDPACGSGSFLVGAYQYLLNYHLDYYIQEKNIKTSLKNKKIFEAGHNTYKLTIDEKQRILCSSIFGVDIDNQAVEVTKLSLYLKLLENESRESSEQLFKYSDMALLPSLEDNIKCGNSLIGRDFYNQGQLDLSDDDRIKVNCFDWEKDGFPDIFKNGGFDVVIGNPPYVRMQIMDKSQTDYFNQYYKSAGYGNYDLYILFIERSLRFLAINGLYGMILPHKFFQAEYGEGIRKIIAEGKNVVQINNFTTNQVFENATTYTCLLFLSRDSNNNFFYQEISLGSDIPDSLNSPIFDTIPSSKLSGKWIFNNSTKEAIFEKISQNTISLEHISRKIFKGSSTGNDDVYLVQFVSRHNEYSLVYSTVLDENVKIENELLKPFIYGQDVRRFFINSVTNYVIFPYHIGEKVTLININVLKSDYPLAFSYFERVRKILMKRKLEFSSGDFYKYSAGRSLSEYAQKKILIPDMLVESRFGIDINGEYYHGPAIHSFVISEQYNYLHYNYILALLSSKLFWFFISHTSTALRGNAYRLTPEYINPFPVKIIDKNNKKVLNTHDALVSLVDKMLDLKKKEAVEPNQQLKTMISRQIDSVDKAIDTAVYQLYNLTNDEIKVVEG
jgi:adenine-specific DNA-methyltransferase